MGTRAREDGAPDVSEEEMENDEGRKVVEKEDNEAGPSIFFFFFFLFKIW